MKSPKEQKIQRLVKPKKEESTLTIGSPKHSALRLNKENDKYEETLYLNKQTKDFDASRKSAKYLDINSPKGATGKPKMFAPSINVTQTQTLPVIENKHERGVRPKRRQEFDDIRHRIKELESKLDNLKGQYKKKPETPQ